MEQFLAAVYLNHETSIAKESDMEQIDGLFGLPKDRELWLAFRKAERLS